MEDIRANLERINKDIPEGVQLLAVTKLHTAEEINQAIDCGVTDIGENKVQELLSKYDSVKPVRWHLIGHLQTNKVKQIIDKVCLIHSVDSLHLAEEIDRRAAAIGKTMDILLQVNAAGEESKFGVAPEELPELLKQVVCNCPNVKVKGLMHIAPFAEDPEDVRIYFREVKVLYDEMKRTEYGKDFEVLSMGMSGDFKVAIDEGSNMVRIGTSIFGARDYSK